MEKSTQMGMNRTGMDSSPIHGKAMASGARQYSPQARDGNGRIAALESSYFKAGHPVGSVPMPGTLKGAAKSMMEKLGGRNPEVLINKLGERLAYERSGVRLYESFIRKCEAMGSGIEPVSIKELRHFCNEEAEHFQMLSEAITSMGADPTAETPDADVSGVAASGCMKVIMDPRTSISQCLETLLTVELADNAAWEVLIELCDGMGLDEMGERFRKALSQEQEHERKVKAWYRQSVSSQIGGPTKH